MQKRFLSPVVLTLILLAVSYTPLLAQWEVSSIGQSSTGLDDGMVIDKNGNLYISQYQGTVVRRLTPDGAVSVYASGFSAPNGLAIDATGILYVANAFGGRISKVTPGGTVTQNFITGVSNPSGLVFNAAGDTLYISHYGSSQISKVALADPGNVTTWVSGSPLNGPIGLAFDADNNLYVGNYNNGGIIKVSPGGTMTELASIEPFLGFLTLSNGYLYATSYTEHKIYRLPLDGSSMEVIAGTGAAGQADGPGTSATFNGPNGIVATASGDTLYVSDFNTGKLRMLVSATSTGVEGAEVPASGLLDLQNFPNPFHASTTITYALTEPSRVSIDIYNMLGQKVRTLASQPLSVGTQSVVWNGRNDAGQIIPRGAYVYTVRAGDFIQSRMPMRR